LIYLIHLNQIIMLVGNGAEMQKSFKQNR